MASVYLTDEELHAGCVLTPQQVLAKHSSGVYTTALIAPDGSVIDWSLHRKRLLRGIELINTRSSRPFHALLSSLQARGSTLPEFFDHHVVPAVKAALRAYFGPSSPKDGREAAVVEMASKPPSAGHQESPSHAMLLVCISPSTPPSPPPPPPSSSSSSSSPSPPVAAPEEPAPSSIPSAAPTESLCSDHVGGPAVEGATADGKERVPQLDGQEGAAADRGASDGCTHGGLPVSITVYCKAVQPPSYGPEHAVQAAVLGRPRNLPGAKASSWVLERRQYEERKPPEAAEVLLSDAEGRILEGLVTNFCVITTTTTTTTAATTTAAAVAAVDGVTSPSAAAVEQGAGGSTPTTKSDDDDDGCHAGRATRGCSNAATAAPTAAAAAGPPSTTTTTPAAAAAGEVTLQLCGPQADAALPGVVQARVVEAAERLGMRLVLEPPRAEDRGTWSEAFITNCIKRIQPLSRVFCPPGNAWGADPWDCVLPHPAGPHTSALLREVERLQERTHWGDL